MEPQRKIQPLWERSRNVGAVQKRNSSKGLSRKRKSAEKRWEFVGRPADIRRNNFKCECCLDKEIPQARSARYADVAVTLKTNRGNIELVLCQEHWLAALAMPEFYQTEDENIASAISPAVN
jgi:hypothetical protein